MSCVLVAYGCSGELRPRRLTPEAKVTEIQRVYEVAKPKPVASVAKTEPEAKPSVLRKALRMPASMRRELRALAFSQPPPPIRVEKVAAPPPPKPPPPKPPAPPVIVAAAKVEPDAAREPEAEPVAAREPEADPIGAQPPEPLMPRKVEHRPKRPTPMSPQQATHHLARAWEKVTGLEATLEVISVFWGQWALETGRGRWMVDYNYAGLKGVAPDGGWAYWWTWEEGNGGPHRIRARFRNYDTADRGAEDYVNLLWRLYPQAVAAAKKGDAKKFIQELEDGGFFTEIPKHYTRSVVSLAAEFRRDTRALRL